MASDAGVIDKTNKFLDQWFASIQSGVLMGGGGARIELLDKYTTMRELLVDKFHFDVLKDIRTGTPVENPVIANTVSEFIAGKSLTEEKSLTALKNKVEEVWLTKPPQPAALMQPGTQPSVTTTVRDMTSSRYNLRNTPLTVPTSVTDRAPRVPTGKLFPDFGERFTLAGELCDKLGFPGTTLTAYTKGATLFNIIFNVNGVSFPKDRFDSTDIQMGDGDADPFLGNNKIHSELNRLYKATTVITPKNTDEHFSRAVRLIFGKNGLTGDPGFPVWLLLYAMKNGISLSETAVCTGDLVTLTYSLMIGVGGLLRQKKAVFNFLTKMENVFDTTFPEESFSEFKKAAASCAKAISKGVAINSSSFQVSEKIMECYMHYPGVKLDETPAGMKIRFDAAKLKISEIVGRKFEEVNEHNKSCREEIKRFRDNNGVDYSVQGNNEYFSVIPESFTIACSDINLLYTWGRISVVTAAERDKIKALFPATSPTISDEVNAIIARAEAAVSEFTTFCNSVMFNKLIGRKNAILLSYNGLFKKAPDVEVLEGKVIDPLKALFGKDTFLVWYKKNSNRAKGGQRQGRRRKQYQTGGSYSSPILVGLTELAIKILPGAPNTFYETAIDEIEPYLRSVNIAVEEKKPFDGHVICAVSLFLTCYYHLYTQSESTESPFITPDGFKELYEQIDTNLPISDYIRYIQTIEADNPLLSMDDLDSLIVSKELATVVGGVRGGEGPTNSSSSSNSSASSSGSGVVSSDISISTIISTINARTHTPRSAEAPPPSLTPQQRELQKLLDEEKRIYNKITTIEQDKKRYVDTYGAGFATRPKDYETQIHTYNSEIETLTILLQEKQDAIKKLSPPKTQPSAKASLLQSFNSTSAAVSKVRPSGTYGGYRRTLSRLGKKKHTRKAKKTASHRSRRTRRRK